MINEPQLEFRISGARLSVRDAVNARFDQWASEGKLDTQAQNRLKATLAELVSNLSNLPGLFVHLNLTITKNTVQLTWRLTEVEVV